MPNRVNAGYMISVNAVLFVNLWELTVVYFQWKDFDY